jgi:hypothetical protein
LPEDPKEIAEIENLEGPVADELKNEIAVE